MDHVKVADEVWIATALLHKEHPTEEAFTVGQIVDRAYQEALHQPLRPGVQVHASQHCVANKRPNPGNYRMLYALPGGRRRLFRGGDDYHPYREGGKITPSPDAVPPRYAKLIDWYHSTYDRPEKKLKREAR